MLADREVGFCNIDQPLFSRSIKPSARTTSTVGYVRLHGRNYENWFAANRSPADRYDYLYSEKELIPWIENARNISKLARETYVVTNNHFRGQAVVNAFEMIAALEDRKVEAPATLLDTYPRLAEIARPV